MPQAIREATIKAKLGLHARPAMHLTAVCQRHPNSIRLRKKDAPPHEQPANAKNILDVMILAAGRGDILVVEIDGPGADALIDEICALLESEFDPAE